MSEKLRFSDVEEGVINYIEDLFKNIENEDKSQLAYSIAFHATNYGCFNTFEGVGILECAKRDYINISEEVLREEIDD